MKKWLRPSLTTAVVGTIAVSVTLLIYLYTTVDQAARENVRTEAMTVLMQLVGIGVVGGLVTWALNERSKEKEQRVQRQEALNEFRRSAIARVVTATNTVRMAPILIKSHPSWEAYDEQGRVLLDVRLDLRSLHHDIRSVKDAFTESAAVRIEIEQKMESYLDRIVNEWADHRSDLAKKALEVESGDAWDEITKLPKIADLLKGDKRSEFSRQYLDGHNSALELMREDIFRPEHQSGSRRPA